MTKKRRGRILSRAAQPPKTPFRKIRDHKLTPLAAGIVAALYPMTPLFAQDEDPGIEEILVTATKRELNIQDVAQSINVLSGADLVKMGASDLQATLRRLPAIQLTALQPGQNSLVVRGISSGVYEYRTEAQVAVYLDEQPMTFNSQQVGIRNVDMQRVEMLPGPQGTLFGSSSQTGTLRYITNKPTTSGVLGQVEASYGTTQGATGSYDVSGVINIPMSDSFAIRAVGYTSHEGGFVDNVYGLSFNGNYDNAELVENDFNEYDVDGGRIHALWNMGDKWSALFSVVGENTTADGVWDSDEALGDYRVTRFENEVRTDDWHSAAVTLNGDLGFADLTVTVTNFQRDIVYEYDNMTYSHYKDRYNGGGLYWELYYAGLPTCAECTAYPLYYTDYYRSIIFNDQTQERDTLEVRLVSSGDSRFQWLIGGYYEDIVDQWYYGSRYDNFVNTTAYGAANAYAWTNYYYGFYDYDCACYQTNPDQAYPIGPTDVGYSNTLDRQVTQTAFFGEVSFDLTDDLTIHGGVRWAEFDRDIFSRFAFPEGLIPFGDLDAGSGNGTFRDVGKVSDTIYKVGIKYNLDDDKMIYGLWSQGFRVGGVNSQRAASTGEVPANYEPDLIDNYEFGIKSQWADNRVTFNADIFYMEWTDYQDTVYGAGAWWIRGNVNVGDAEIRGIEAQLDWYVNDQFSISASGFVQDSEFTENICNTFVGGVRQPCVILPDGSIDPDDLDIRAGMLLPNSPKASGTIGLTYEVPNVLGGDLWFFYDFSWAAESWNSTGNIVDNDTDGISPSWTYHTFSAGLRLPNQFDIELNIQNLTNEAGYSYVGTWEADYAEQFNDSRYRRVRAQDRPRTYWLTLRKGFGGT